MATSQFEQESAHGTPVLEVRNLRVHAHNRRGARTTIIDDVSFSVQPGEVIALIGESGSGKTTLSLAAMGYARAGCELTSGEVRLAGNNVLQMPLRDRRELRGKDVAYIAQSAAAAFNSALKLNRQVTETPIIKGLLTRREALQRAIELYRELDLPEPERIGARYPHQVSGGQLQRLMAAMAMISGPRLLILDEPTTALDVTTQVEVLRAFKQLIRAQRRSAIYVSHDLAVVAQIADHVLVLRNGAVVEYGEVERIVHQPEQAYTRQLLAAAHVMPQQLPTTRAQAAEDVPLLRVCGVSARYGGAQEPLALRDVSLVAHRGRTLGVIGESGSGKTTLGRVISGLMAAHSGHIELLGERLPGQLAARTRTQLQRIAFVFQMADVALNPRHRVDKILGRPLVFYHAMGKAARRQRVAELLALVELPDGYASRLPSQLSGGERQRVNIARALAAEPALIICDEVTSALDTIVASAILDLLRDLQQRLGISYLFISHDLSTIARVADTVAVMRNGEVLEQGPTSSVLAPPQHAYTEALLRSVPELRTNWLDQLS